MQWPHDGRSTFCHLGAWCWLPSRMPACHADHDAALFAACETTLRCEPWHCLLLIMYCLYGSAPCRDIQPHRKECRDKSLSCIGVRFFEKAAVTDPDNEAKTFEFCVLDCEHCACFNMGEGADGSPVISWSDLATLYQLPDGSKWAEHGFFYDREDLVSSVALMQ